MRKFPEYILTPADNIVELKDEDGSNVAIYQYQDKSLITIELSWIDNPKTNYRTFRS